MDEYISNAKQNEARISSETGKSSQEGKDINWIYPDSLSHNMKFEQLTFRFRSFCPFMLAKYGLLIPGENSKKSLKNSLKNSLKKFFKKIFKKNLQKNLKKIFLGKLKKNSLKNSLKKFFKKSLKKISKIFFF